MGNNKNLLELASEDNEPRLTPAERKVVRTLATTEADQDAADQLCISLNTLRRHGNNIIAKLGLAEKGVRGLSGLRSYLNGIQDGENGYGK